MRSEPRRDPDGSLHGAAGRLICAVCLLVVVSAVVPSVSQAAWWAYRFLNTSFCACSPLQGSRATIWTPNSSEPRVSYNGWFLTAVMANASDNLIQAGVTYEYSAPQTPSCDLGVGAPALYHFVEVEHNGANYCYSRSTSAWSTANMYSVVRNTDGYWRAYRNGVYMEVRTQWTPCSGNACQIEARGEERLDLPGFWPAKFAGSGYTQWQRNGGSGWVNIQSAQMTKDYQWSDGGPFPTGKWNFTYSK